VADGDVDDIHLTTIRHYELVDARIILRAIYQYDAF
jgi:hypothetical protein